jgi:hypothetical protein
MYARQLLSARLWDSSGYSASSSQLVAQRGIEHRHDHYSLNGQGNAKSDANTNRPCGR